MPVRTEMVGDLFHVWFHGTLSAADLAQLTEQMRAMEARAATVPSRIVDMSGITGVSIGFDDMSHVAEERKAMTLPNPIKTAVVAPEPLQMGFARMFQTLNVHPRVTMMIFRDRESAMSWLAVPLERPPA